MKLLKIFKTLGDESRLRILRVLLHGRYNVNELKEILNMGQSRVSRHLKLLVDAELALVYRQGTWSYYEANLRDVDAEITLQLELIRKNADRLSRAEEDEAGRLLCLERRRQQSRVFHDKVASDWYRLREELLGRTEITEFLLEPIGFAPVVVDLGCGPGVLLPKLAQRSRHVIGVDSSPAMLDEARSFLTRELSSANGKEANVELRLGSIEHLPLADGEVQAALMNMVLHHLADPRTVLKEVRRVLSADGKLVICDLARHGQEWMRDRYADLWLGFTTEELGRFLFEAGFEVLASRQIDNSPRTGVIVTVARVTDQGGTR